MLLLGASLGSRLAPIVLVLAAFGLPACADGIDPNRVTLTEECATCLQTADGGAGGCGVEEQACSADSRCDRAMLCLLRLDCLQAPAETRCAQRHGCTTDARESRARLGDFEVCARTACADACGFAAP